MLTLRRNDERGHAEHGWLESWHTFSFADYHDPRHMGFRALRVINEDFVAPGEGFPTHAHRDMEILTWVLEGTLRHQDSLGNGSEIRPGEMQYMSAGQGVAHSEFNASESARVHLLQIWIQPEIAGATPRYDQKDFGAALERGAPVLLASRDGREGSIAIRQDARLFVARPAPDAQLALELAPGRQAWVHVARGALEVNGHALVAGDALAVREEGAVRLARSQAAEVLVFDLA